MPKKTKSKKKKKKKEKDVIEKPDYSYITEEEMKKGFKPSDTPQEGIIICSNCSSTNFPEDDYCFNCSRRLEKEIIPD